ncbi:taco-1, partial [Pristionchus pacificus]
QAWADQPKMLLSSIGRLSTRPSVCATLHRSISSSPITLKGHSKWQNIKATKGKNDLIKSQAMNHLLKKVTAATRKGGFDLKLNRDLAGLEQEFRAQGLPLDTFKTYLQRLKDKPEQPFRFEIIGPSGSFFILETEAPNRSGIASTIQKYMNKIGGFRLAADSSAVLTWFDSKGVVRVDSVNKEGKTIPFEKAEEMGIELDCEQVDSIEGEDGKTKFEMLCEPKQVNIVEEGLSSQGLVIESAETEMRPKHPISLSEADQKVVEKFYEFLQDDENVKQIFDNIQSDD